jgi:hypothetical protein
MLHSGTGGGAAAAAGFSFQASIAAWAAVDVLAERAATPRWGLEPAVFYTEVRCETGLPVDDILIVTSAAGGVYLQAKRSIALSPSEDSDLASAIGQFVRHFLGQRSQRPGRHPWERPLDPERDRLVLMTDGQAPKWAKVHLPAVLQRFRRDSQLIMLPEAATNNDERLAARTLLSHAQTLWRRLGDGDPSPLDLRTLFSLIRVDFLDLRIDAVDGREDVAAMDKLRQAVLVNPSQAETAYNLLKAYCQTLTATRSGTDRADLLRELLRSGIQGRPAFGMKPDIQRLHQRTLVTLDQLSTLAVIEMDGSRIKIDRPVVSALVKAVEQNSGNCLVIGEPGAGKSGALHEAVSEMLRRSWDVVFLAADVLGADSIGNLRQDLGIEHDLVPLLEQWEGPTPGVLVIDALDAARAERMAGLLRHLIGQVVRLKGRWRVIGSIREFDLRCSGEWQDLFRGPPPSADFSHADFSHVRHLNIPRLDEAELAQVAEQSQELGALLVETRGKPLHELLRQPFNLRLGASLLSDGLSVADLTPLRTQIELLDRYWNQRVLGSDAGRSDRQALARMICEGMVARQELRLPITLAESAGRPQALHQLLSQGVISQVPSTGSSRSREDWLAFSHHVLFDYATARTLLRSDSHELVRRLENSPYLVLLIRPSYALHFEHLWLDDASRHEFWSVVLEFLRSNRIPKVSQLIGPEVSTESARYIADLEPLLDALGHTDQAEREAAEKAVEHVVGSLLATGHALVGDEGDPWCEWAERVSRHDSIIVISALRNLLVYWMDRVPQMTDDQKSWVGMMARRLLEFAEDRPWLRKSLYFATIPMVCRTFASAPNESKLLISKILQPRSLDEGRVNALSRISQELRVLIALSPDLVEQVYSAVFRADEAPDERVPLGSSRILSLAVSLRDEFEIVKWNLAEVFPGFIDIAPTSALRSLAVSLEEYTRRERFHSEKPIVAVFDFRNHPALFIEDGSGIWDEGSLRQDESPVRMVSALEDHLVRLSRERQSGLPGFLDLIAETQSSAIVWRRLLRAGASQPDPLGVLLLPLVEAEPVLATIDTTYQAGQFLRSIFRLLEPEARRRVEETILELPKSNLLIVSDPADRERRRDCLLGCLSVEEVVTEAARRRLREMQAAQSVPPNEPPFQFRFEYGKETERQRSGRGEIPFDAAEMVEYRDLLAPLKDFLAKYRNETPGRPEIKEVASAIWDLSRYLSSGTSPVLKAAIDTEALDQLSDCIQVVFRYDYMLDDAEFVELARRLLLQASEHTLPLAADDSNDRFDHAPSWERPSPRVVAAEGLMRMARDHRTSSPDILDAIQRLIRDPAPAVRYTIAYGISMLRSVETVLMWRLIDDLAQHEPSLAVLFSLTQGTLDTLLTSSADDLDHVVEIVELIRVRTSGWTQSSDQNPRRRCLAILLRIYINFDHPRCREVLFRIAADPEKHAVDLNYLCGLLREVLDERSKRVPDSRIEAVRSRAWVWTNMTCENASRVWQRLRGQYQQAQAPAISDEARETYRNLAKLIDKEAREIYFASGAYDAKKGRGASDREMPSGAQRDFFTKALTAIEHLADAGLASAAHHLIETLRYFIDVDPSKVFVLVGRIVNHSTVDAYHHESVGAELIVGIVERYLADYRALFRENEQHRQLLIEILDTFVAWPEARKLAYGLGEVFR